MVWTGNLIMSLLVHGPADGEEFLTRLSSVASEEVRLGLVLHLPGHACSKDPAQAWLANLSSVSLYPAIAQGKSSLVVRLRTETRHM